MLYFQGGKEAAVIRGPIASKVITQLLCATDWGDTFLLSNLFAFLSNLFTLKK